MKLTMKILVAALGVALVSSIPVPEERSLRSQALDRLVMVEGDNEEALRSKRTIGVLRQLFPGISQMIEQKVNMITSEVIRVLGPTILRQVLNNGGGGGGATNSRTTGSSSGTTVEIEAPPSDDDDDDSSSASSSSSSSSTSQNSGRVSIALPTYPPDEEDEATGSMAANKSAPAASTTSSSTTSEKSSDVNREAEDRLTEETAESQNNEVRVQFADDQSGAAANEAVESELAPLEDIEVSDDENRNKRFLNFGFGAGAPAAAGGGSGGGSGNFLFDIIRQAADGAARAAGTVYRVVAGTQSLGLGLSASRDVGPAPPAAPAPSGPAAPAPPGAPVPLGAPAPPGAPAAAKPGPQPPLVAGSGSSQQGDVAAGAPSPGRNDGTTEAVPGPVTRLFVIANRGISNLIQDLILRLAATSERIVNFKARLITSII